MAAIKGFGKKVMGSKKSRGFGASTKVKKSLGWKALPLMGKSKSKKGKGLFGK